MSVLGLGGLLYMDLAASGAEVNSICVGCGSIAFQLTYCIKFASQFHLQAKFSGRKHRTHVQFFWWQLFHSSEFFNLPESMLSIQGYVYDLYEFWCSPQSKAGLVSLSKDLSVYSLSLRFRPILSTLTRMTVISAEWPIAWCCKVLIIKLLFYEKEKAFALC